MGAALFWMPSVVSSSSAGPTRPGAVTPWQDPSGRPSWITVVSGNKLRRYSLLPSDPAHFRPTGTMFPCQKQRTCCIRHERSLLVIRSIRIKPAAPYTAESIRLPFSVKKKQGYRSQDVGVHREHAEGADAHVVEVLVVDRHQVHDDALSHGTWDACWKEGISFLLP